MFVIYSNGAPPPIPQGKCTCLKPVPPTIYGTTTNGAAANGYLSYPTTPVPPHHAMHAGPPLALTWGGAAGNGGTINSQKMLPPPPASIHGSNFGTVGAHSYLRFVLQDHLAMLDC